ncbi:hypothetical protein RvY_04765 [Ramazzottius varieornatus]|uniref:Uncharacterized protein n=1 Tax=Ramazzottius varieornatus TaxID=947166 RepID=A0A1D1V2N4_RAMVA|nr:hypothetical protein RvY_04765 [Ramazzottius varieornatus]
MMDSAEEPIEQKAPEPVEPVPVNDSPIEPGVEVRRDTVTNDAVELPPPEDTPVQLDGTLPEVLPEVTDAPVEKGEENTLEQAEAPQADRPSLNPPESPVPDEKTEKRGKKAKEGRGKGKKKEEVEMENPNNVGQQVDFDGPRKDPRHSHSDMTTNDLKVALQFYGTLDREFLHDLLLKHFEDRELENLFCDVLDTEGEDVYATSQCVKKGTLNFDELNQRFIGIPAACASETPCVS